MSSKKKKFKHGHYVFEKKNGFYIFNSYLKRGRAFLPDGRVLDIDMKKHPKTVKAILTKGKRHVCSGSFKRREEW